MQAFLLDKDKNRTLMPELTGWEIIHSTENCDSFEVECVYSGEMTHAIETASEILCVHDGKTVFCGVIDEHILKASGTGATITVSGRGYAARLLDNEAEAAEYWGAKLPFVLERHVYPCGIANVKFLEMECAGRFVVSSGDSQWRVLRDFCCFCGGVTPRFDRIGTLLLNGEAGEIITFENAPITSQMYRDKRYGVFSHVLVKNRVTGGAVTIENPALIARGGLCRRVVNVPRYTQYDFMRYTGEYQIFQSKKLSCVCTVKLPLMFCAFAGDVIELNTSPRGINGTFYVTESVCAASGEGGETTLTLVRKEA